MFTCGLFSMEGLIRGKGDTNKNKNPTGCDACNVGFDWRVQEPWVPTRFSNKDPVERMQIENGHFDKYNNPVREPLHKLLHALHEQCVIRNSQMKTL